MAWFFRTGFWKCPYCVSKQKSPIRKNWQIRIHYGWIKIFCSKNTDKNSSYFSFNSFDCPIFGNFFLFFIPEKKNCILKFFFAGLEFSISSFPIFYLPYPLFSISAPSPSSARLQPLPASPMKTLGTIWKKRDSALSHSSISLLFSALWANFPLCSNSLSYSFPLLPIRLPIL